MQRGVVFGAAFCVGGGVWERLLSVSVMNAVSPEPVFYNPQQQCSSLRASHEHELSLILR